MALHSHLNLRRMHVPMKGIVCCFGRDGLGNRMLTAELACRQALRSRKRISLDWSDPVMKLSPSAMAKYFSIEGLEWFHNFDFDTASDPIPKDRTLWSHDGLLNMLLEVPDPRGWRSAVFFWYRYARWRRHYRYRRGGFAMRNGEYLGEDLLSRDAVLMYCSIPEREPEHFRHFKIAGSFMESMEQWCSSQGLSAAPELAIHVRHTDKSEASLEPLMAALEMKLSEESSPSVVHIATDNAQVLARITSVVGSRAVVQRLKINRSDDPIHLRDEDATEKEKGMELALRELLILSMAKTFWFQESSSFSRVALALSGSSQTCVSWSSF